VARPRRRVSPETERVLLARQAALTALTQHPSWEELVEEVGRKRTRIEKIVLAKTLSGAQPVDPIEMSFLRGFVAGMEWFARVPAQAEASLERFLKEQGVEGAARE
jgi:hypothetical protein